MNKSIKILFLLHDASRTGATIVLLRFLRWLKKNSDWNFEILLRHGGYLVKDFSALAPTVVVFQDTNKLVNKLINGSLPARLHYLEYQSRARQIRSEINNRHFDLIYANTALVGDVLAWLKPLLLTTITHIHELEGVIRGYVGLKAFQLVKKHSDHYISASCSVKSNLVENHHISPENISTVHEFIDPQEFTPSTNVQANTSTLKNSQSLHNAFIVGGSGTYIPRKGYDLFIQLAEMVQQRQPDLPIHFLWIGGSKASREYRDIQENISARGLSERVHFIPEVPHPFEYYRRFDVFAMVSREDPYPLVNLEVAAQRKPILCFENAGGSPEFVEADAGFIVPFLDLEAMADKIILLAENPTLKKRLGNRGAEKVITRHNVDQAAPQLCEIIKRFTNKKKKYHPL